MSCISTSGHQHLYVNFWHIDIKLSNSVDDSQWNKFGESKFKNHSAQQFKNEHKFKSNAGKSSEFNAVFFGQKTENSDSKGKNEISPYKNVFSGKELKVIIAEDDDVSSQLLTIILKDISIEIIRTRTGRETIEQCKEHKDIDLILMDIKMPELDGFETTKKIREFNKDVHIIAQTARAMQGDKEEALFAGCNDYISKPIDRVVLLKKFQFYFNTRFYQFE